MSTNTKTLTKGNVPSGSFDLTDKLLYLDDTAGIKGVGASDAAKALNAGGLEPKSVTHAAGNKTIGQIKQMVADAFESGYDIRCITFTGLLIQHFVDNFMNDSYQIPSTQQGVISFLRISSAGTGYWQAIIGQYNSRPLTILQHSPSRWMLFEIPVTEKYVQNI